MKTEYQQKAENNLDIKKMPVYKDHLLNVKQMYDFFAKKAEIDFMLLENPDDPLMIRMRGIISRAYAQARFLYMNEEDISACDGLDNGLNFYMKDGSKQRVDHQLS